MDGIHDFGGKQGYGSVRHTVNTDDYSHPLHNEWDELGYALVAAAEHAPNGKAFTWDKVRHGIERIDPVRYLTSDYFDRVVIGLATAYVEGGVISKDELDQAAGGDFQLAQPVISSGREAPSHATFQVGERVHVSGERVNGHIRMPSFCRGKFGTVLHKTTEEWPFPDAYGHWDVKAEPECTYHVKFDRQELWGPNAEPGSVVVDLFEGYLEKVAA
ncbi:nitrile hydratase subunit beta [Comamonas sp. Y6]|uniref:Nitrile hydratase subunit beta n=1 Tax=Comamonas resistens TaxID=3046670 RepID=A0ABY8SQ99_9BURK|nr:nitrile hydratase subunit beta [Comamonas resistens]MDL5035840.1 nitrile hydratase subunit beta [Comamonas resistens]WHS65248.1 nitrile hydratase subunit beta [Comamonas resistens]